MQFLQEESVRCIALEYVEELFPQKVHTASSFLVLPLYAFVKKCDKSLFSFVMWFLCWVSYLHVCA
jgi:hypothetical protein